MGGQLLQDPKFVPEIIRTVGILPVLDWTKHFIALGLYTLLSSTLEKPLKQLGPRLSPKQQFQLNRRLDQWRFGAGLDYKL